MEYEKKSRLKKRYSHQIECSFTKPPLHFQCLIVHVLCFSFVNRHANPQYILVVLFLYVTRPPQRYQRLWIIFYHLRTINMPCHILKIVPHALWLRLAHPISSMHFCLKLFPTLRYIMMQRNSIPCWWLTECYGGDHSAIFTNSICPWSQVEFVWIHRRSTMGGFNYGFDMGIGGAFTTVVEIIINAGCEGFPS
jgi:hypothetical protein